MIEFRNVGKHFRRGDGLVEVLGSIDFEVRENEILSLFGPNGCGKSTLMNILAGLEHPSRGDVLGLGRLKREVGFVFQEYRATLLPWLSAGDNILFPLKLRGLGRREQKRRLADLMELSKADFSVQQPVHTLSGGQAQMVALLRALIIAPRLLVLDEPFSALDYTRTLELHAQLAEISRALRLSVILISHDLEEALFLGDRVVLLSRPPTLVTEVVSVPFTRPRPAALRASRPFLDIKAKALKIFLASLGEPTDERQGMRLASR